MKISVVIPAFDAASTLDEALESIARQTLPADEVMVVDDGSTDATSDVVLASPHARLLRQENAGPAVALNRGVAATTGDLLAFLDADDVWDPRRLEIQRAFLANGADAVIGKVELYHCPTLTPEVARRYPLPEEPQDGWVVGALLVRREAFERVGPFAEDLRLGYNIDWFDRARGVGVEFPVLDATVLRRRVHPGSLSHRNASKDREYLEMARRAVARRRAEAARSSTDPS